MKKSAVIAIIGAFIVGIADVIFKYFAITRLPTDGSLLVSPIDFALHKNPGIAFDIPVPLPIVILVTVLIGFFLIRLAIRSWSNHPNTSGAAIIVLIGAYGNMLDRIINGFTTDYLIFFRTSAINLSDILIITGTFLLLCYTKHKDDK